MTGPRSSNGHGADRARRIQAASWALVPSLPIGLFLGISQGIKAGLGLGISILIGLLAVVALTAILTGIIVLLTELAGGLASQMAHPNSVRYRFDHSGAKALVVRGEITKGVAAFEAATVTHPDDPAPCIELARIHRDQLSQPEKALDWFRKARGLVALTPAESKIVMREMLELARRRLNNPARVAPDLARHAERFEGTDEADWARRELAELKAGIQADQGGDS